MVALFLAPVAHGQTVPDPAAGTQAVSKCPEPRMAKLPAKRKVDAMFNVRAASVADGTQWLLRIDGHDWAAGTAENNAIRHEVKMVDFGLRPRTVKVDLVLANESCENSPWKLTRRVGYAGRYNGALTPPDQPAQEQNQTPAAPGAGTAAPGGSTPTPKAPVIPKIPKPKEFRPLQAPANGRVWVTASDVTAHSTEKLTHPKLPRAELQIDDAQSTNALAALGILFVVIAVATGLGLFFLNKKDESANVAAEEGRLPSHLDTSDMGNLQLSEAGRAVVQKGAVPSLLTAEATAPVLGEEAPTNETPTEVIPGHVEPDHIASEPGDVPVPVAGAEPSHQPLPPPLETVGNDNIQSFLEERAPTDDEVPPAAEPHPTIASAGALHAAAATADEDLASEAANEAGAKPDEAEAAPNEAEAAPNGQAADANGVPDEVEPFDAIINSIVNDGGVQDELRGIVAEAREEALRQGLPIDRDGIIAEVDRMISAANLSPPAHKKLMGRLQQVVSDELERVPQAH